MKNLNINKMDNVHTGYDYKNKEENLYSLLDRNKMETICVTIQAIKMDSYITDSEIQDKVNSISEEYHKLGEVLSIYLDYHLRDLELINIMKENMDYLYNEVINLYKEYLSNK